MRHATTLAASRLEAKTLQSKLESRGGLTGSQQGVTGTCHTSGWPVGAICRKTTSLRACVSGACLWPTPCLHIWRKSGLQLSEHLVFTMESGMRLLRNASGNAFPILHRLIFACICDTRCAHVLRRMEVAFSRNIVFTMEVEGRLLRNAGGDAFPI